MMGKKGGILGVGNVLQQDDGIGIKVLKYLEANYIFPENVELIDGGTTGAGLDTSIYDKDWLIVLDALAISGDPGEVKLLREEAFINKPSSIRMTPHQVGFLDLIQILRIDDTGPKHVDLIGIIPKYLDFLPVLSPEVEASMDKVVAILFEWLKQKNIVPEKQNSPKSPDYWWLPVE